MLTPKCYGLLLNRTKYAAAALSIWPIPIPNLQRIHQSVCPWPPFSTLPIRTVLYCDIGFLNKKLKIRIQNVNSLCIIYIYICIQYMPPTSKPTFCHLVVINLGHGFCVRGSTIYIHKYAYIYIYRNIDICVFRCAMVKLLMVNGGQVTPSWMGYPNPFTIIHHSSWPSSFIWKKWGSKPLESFFCLRISGKPDGLL